MHVCLLMPCGHLLGNSWLSFVMSNCDVVTFQLVSWVRCGALLYRFLIFARFVTFKIKIHLVKIKALLLMLPWKIVMALLLM